MDGSLGAGLAEGLEDLTLLTRSEFVVAVPPPAAPLTALAWLLDEAVMLLTLAFTPLPLPLPLLLPPIEEERPREEYAPPESWPNDARPREAIRPPPTGSLNELEDEDEEEGPAAEPEEKRPLDDRPENSEWVPRTPAVCGAKVPLPAPPLSADAAAAWRAMR